MVQAQRQEKMTQMEKDLRLVFMERIHKCCEDLLNRCMKADLDVVVAPAIIATVSINLGAKLTGSLTTMPVETFLDDCRKIFEAARKEAEEEGES